MSGVRVLVGTRKGAFILESDGKREQWSVNGPLFGGTIRDHVTRKRRPFVRFYACEQDYSHDGYETLLPDAGVSGREPFLVVGAMAGG